MGRDDGRCGLGPAPAEVVKWVLLTFLLKVSPGRRAPRESGGSCSQNLHQPGRCKQHWGWIFCPSPGPTPPPGLKRPTFLLWGCRQLTPLWGCPLCGWSASESCWPETCNLHPVTGRGRSPMSAPWMNLGLLLSTAPREAGSDLLRNCCSAALCSSPPLPQKMLIRTLLFGILHAQKCAWGHLAE